MITAIVRFSNFGFLWRGSVGSDSGDIRQGSLRASRFLATLWRQSCAFVSKKHPAYNLDPRGVEGAFEPLLTKYLRAAEFVIGLATGSIVLLVGSSALHGRGGLPWFYASPLLLLAFCVLYGILFMVWLILSYSWL